MCREQAVGYLDLEGNARLAFDGVFMERLVSDKPSVERRELKSLFKPKSAQVLRTMLRDPNRAWRVTELAETTGVSLGHVSNVRVGLLDREWAQVSGEGLLLSEPDALLDAWRNAYEPPPAPAPRKIEMAQITPPEPQSAADYDDRTGGPAATTCPLQWLDRRASNGYPKDIFYRSDCYDDPPCVQPNPLPLPDNR